MCGHIFAERHRVLSGEIGGIYTPRNIIWLCPNHHAAIHHVFCLGRKRRDTWDGYFDQRFYYYTEDDRHFIKFSEVMDAEYSSLELSFLKHHCNHLDKLPKDVGQKHIRDFCNSIAKWRKTHGKGWTYETPERQVADSLRSYEEEEKRWSKNA